MDSSLLETAMIRAGEQEVLFSHTRPDGAACFSANAAMIAENVAINQRSASEVMNSWMNSEGHRENIPVSYTHLSERRCGVRGEISPDSK